MNHLKSFESLETRDQKVNFLRSALKTGVNPVTGAAFTMADAVQLPYQEKRHDAISMYHASSVTVPEVLIEVARENIEPLQTLSRLFDVIPYRPEIKILYGGLGGEINAKFIGEGQEYPESTLQFGGQAQSVSIGKYGTSFKLTEEMIKYSAWDIIGMHLRACIQGLARLKEAKCAEFITESGIRIFDNNEPSLSVLGTTTGRNAAGAANGTITHDDIFDMFGVLMARGFMPNLLIVHPLTWVMFMKDPMLRHIALAGNGSQFWGQYSGSPVVRNPFNPDPINQPSGATNVFPQSPVTTGSPTSAYTYAPQMTAAPVIPSYMSPFPFTVIPSYAVYCNMKTKRTDLILAQAGEIGAILQEGGVEIDDWTDFARDIRKLKVKERWSLVIYHDGQAIGTARNITIGANQVLLPAQAQFDVTSLPAISGSTPV